MSRLAWGPLVLVAAACSAPGPGRGSPGPAPQGAKASPLIDGSRPLPSPLPAVVALVNGEPVRLRNILILARRSLQPGGPLPMSEAPAVYRKALEDSIDRELLFQEAMARKIVLDDRDVEQAYDEARLAYKDEELWRTYLKDQRMDPRIFRGELRVKLTVQALIRQENSKVPPATREEAEDFYKQNPRSFDSGERVHCRRILIPVEPGVPEGARAVFRSNAEAILKRVKSGQDFAKVARETSGDKDTAAKGGDLGVLARSQMSEAAAKAAFALKPREVSDVVETPQGFEILKLEERKEPVKLTFEQAQNQIRLHLDSKKRQEALQALVGSLRSKARIETFL